MKSEMNSGFHLQQPVFRAAWADFDNDGDLDCYLVNWLSPNTLYRNDGNTFTDIAPELDLDINGFGRSAIWFDYDNDGDADLYLANSKGQRDFLFRNEAGILFTDVTENAGLLHGTSSIGAAAADYDSDGDQDLYITCGWYEQDRFYENIDGQYFQRIDSKEGFKDLSADTDVSWIDYDNDADLDLYIVTQNGANRLYENQNGQFQEIANSIGLADSSNGMGAVWADFNRDGFLDIFLVNGDSAPNRLFQNQGNSNNWLFLNLEGTKSNRQGIGAKVWLYAGDIIAFREVQSCWGFTSQSSSELSFGIGQRTMIDSVIIDWPSGIHQTIHQVPINQYIKIVEKATYDKFFQDITLSSNLLDTTSISRSASCADIDDDGLLDLFINNAYSKNQMYFNSLQGYFNLQSEQGGIDYLPFEDTYSSTYIDIENDGDLDLFVVNQYYRCMLFLQEGQGYFREVGNEFGISSSAASVRAAWADFDNDGDLDCYLVNWLSPNKLYRNDNTFFTDIAMELGLDVNGFGRSAIWFDYDNDGDADLYLANSKGQRDFLFKNDGNSGFTDATENAGLLSEVSSIGAAAGDYDSDGDQDLYVTGGWYEQDHFYENIDGIVFRRIEFETGLRDSSADTDVSWIDYDNDADLDLYILNQHGVNRFYENQNGQFQDIADSIGLADSSNGMGAVWADFNRDGFLDIYLVNGDSAPNRLFQNPGNSNNSIFLKLEGTTSNRQGIGAKVWLHAGDIVLFREVQSCWGFTSQSSTELSFGLGSRSGIDSIVIKWPSGIQQVERQLLANQIITIQEKSTSDVGEYQTARPEYFELRAHPNPFSTHTQFSLQLSDMEVREFVIINILGETVRAFSGETLQRGSKTIIWDGTDNGGNLLPTGVYFARLAAGNNFSLKKLILIR